MLQSMVRIRHAAVALLGCLAALPFACAAKQQNGQECLKSVDCESERCIQFVCVDPDESKIPVGNTDTGLAAETGPDAADTGTAMDAPGDTGAPDTGSPDTGTPDTGTMPDDTGTD